MRAGPKHTGYVAKSKGKVKWGIKRVMVGNKTVDGRRAIMLVQEKETRLPSLHFATATTVTWLLHISFLSRMREAKILISTLPKTRTSDEKITSE